MPPVTCRDTILSPSFPACRVGKRSLRLFSICTHILGVLPSRQTAFGTARRSERLFLPVLYLLPCSSAPVCRCRPADWGYQANRHSTQWTRRIIFVEGRDRDRLSHNSPHHQYFTPSREPNKSLWLIQIIISRIWWLAHLDALWKELQQKVLSQASYLDVVCQRSLTELSLTNIRHIALIISFLVVRHKLLERDKIMNS